MTGCRWILCSSDGTSDRIRLFAAGLEGGERGCSRHAQNGCAMFAVPRAGEGRSVSRERQARLFAACTGLMLAGSRGVGWSGRGFGGGRGRGMRGWIGEGR